MLKKLNRLRKSREIQKVFKSGRSIKSADFSIRFAPSRLPVNRVAIVVSNKVDKRATRRNALKRCMREVVRQNLQSLPAGFDIILTAYKLPNWPLKLADIEPEIKGILGKIR